MAGHDLSTIPEITESKERNPATRTWLKHFTVRMPGVNFPAEVVARTNGKWLAEKAIPIFVDQANMAEFEHVRGQCSNQDLFRYLNAIGFEKLSVVLIESLRPVYFFPWPDNLGKSQLELPGGLSEEGEDSYGVAGLREMLEELGLEDGEVLAHSPVYPSPAANDAGTHVERYGMSFVLCTGRPRSHEGGADTRLKEGIVGVHSFGLSSFLDDLFENQRTGRPVEQMALMAAFALEARMKGCR